MHEVQVNHLGGISLPRKSVVRLTDRLDMTTDVYRGRKTTTLNLKFRFLKQHNSVSYQTLWSQNYSYTFVSPSADSRGAVVSYWRKYVHEVLVNRSGLSLPRKSVVPLTDHPHMTLDVYRGRKTTKQQQQHKITAVNINPIALRKAKIVCNFGLSECNRVKRLGLINIFHKGVNV